MILIYVTYPDLNAAKKTVHSLLEKRLVACGNIIPGMNSIYRWQGKIEEATEVIVIFKTQSHLYEECQSEIQKEHPYQVPCIIQWDIQKGSSTYFAWLTEETQPVSASLSHPQD